MSIAVKNITNGRVDSSTKYKRNIRDAINNRDARTGGNTSSSREANNSRDHSNTWDSRNTNGTNNIGKCRVNSSSRGNRTITDKLARAGVVATEGTTATADMPGTSRVSNISRGASNSRYFSNRGTPATKYQEHRTSNSTRIKTAGGDSNRGRPAKAEWLQTWKFFLGRDIACKGSESAHRGRELVNRSHDSA
jgi:hypothetical protein